MPEFIRAYCERAADGKEGEPIRFVASTENIARDDMVIRSDAWQLENYRKNPVFLWAHGYASLPIGRATVEVAEGELIADVTFDQEDDFARQVESKYRRGFLSAVSVGWETLEADRAQNPDVRAVITKAELQDISAVPVPADPDALKTHQLRGLAELGGELMRLLEPSADTTHAMPPHTTDKAPEDTAWDARAEVAKAEGKDQLRQMHAWVSDEGTYELPHHEADNGQVVWRGVAAAMARLLNASTQIPDADRRGVYSHLSRHYEQFSKEPPEYRTHAELVALSAVEIRGLFLEGEAEMYPDLFQERTEEGGVAELTQAVRELITAIKGPQHQPPTDPDPADGDVLEELHALFTSAPLGPPAER